MTPSVSPETDRELSEGTLFYTREGGVKVGLAFVAEFERVLALICAHPEIGTLWRNGRRRFPVRKFSYSVVYYVRGEEIRGVALAHHRRRPGYWAARK